MLATTLLLAIRDSLRPGAAGEAHFVSIQGEGEYRRRLAELEEQRRAAEAAPSSGQVSSGAVDAYQSLAKTGFFK